MSERSLTIIPGLPGGRPLAHNSDVARKQRIIDVRCERKQPARVVLATEDRPGVELSTPNHPSVNMTETAIEGFKSIRKKDRAASILTAMISTVYRAMDAGAPREELQIVNYGIRILSEIFEGDFSDPLVPERQSNRQTPSLFLCARAWVMGAVILQERLDNSDRISACSKIAYELDRWLAPAKLKDTLPRYNARDRGMRSESENKGFHECSRRIYRWIKSEEKNSTDRLPAHSAAALQYAAITRWLTNNTPTHAILDRHLETCARMLIDSSVTAQRAILGEEVEIE